MTKPDVITYGAFDEAVMRRVQSEVAGHGNLGQVVAWGAAAKPPHLPVETIAQAEYTHDVIVPYEDGLYLVYDVT